MFGNDLEYEIENVFRCLICNFFIIIYFLYNLKHVFLCKTTNVININKKTKNEFGFHTKILTIGTFKISCIIFTHTHIYIYKDNSSASPEGSNEPPDLAKNQKLYINFFIFFFTP